MASGLQTDGVRLTAAISTVFGGSDADFRPTRCLVLLQTLNQHPASTADRLPTFRVGVSEDRNKKCRRTMEDAHSFVYDYCGVPGQGYFAVFE